MKWGNRQAREEAKWEQEEEDRGELEETLGQSYEGNIGKKKLQNLQDKAEKKKQREVEQQEREEFKKRREAFDVKERLQSRVILILVKLINSQWAYLQVVSFCSLVSEQFSFLLQDVSFPWW